MFFIISAVCLGILILFFFILSRFDSTCEVSEAVVNLLMIGAAMAFIGTITFLVLGIFNLPYFEVQRYELRDYSLTVTESPLFGSGYSERFTGTTYDHMEFELDLHEIRKEGKEPVLVKYERKLLGVSSYRYDLILPADLVGEKAG
ncbi:hypothetical protein [Marasmitruncus massiliensis]|uniref:hypothetical protein n=1 Tax=Marasmitruncus massiliensis TaxID=1944642 RepID=UPI000C7AE74D|nr:hypothetical protein [Marasmitruncus massiliensis]